MLDFLGPLATIYDLPTLIQTGGYALLAIIIFAETGLFFGFFLPGDSLLVTAGVFAARGDLNLLHLNLLLIVAAVVGDAFGYYFGKKAGPMLFSRNYRFLNKEHLLRAKRFYDEHGGKTIILARFVPVVRTFAPIVAGALQMNYSKFASYNIIGGALWVLSLTLLGFYMGNVIPDLDKHLFLLIAAIVLLSFVPIAIEHLRRRSKEI